MWFVLILCVIAALADVLGGFLTVFKTFNKSEIRFITSLGAGFLLGATLLDRLPDSMSKLPHSAPLYMMMGYLLILVVSQFNAHQHSGHVSEHLVVTQSSVDHLKEARSQAQVTQRSAFISFISLMLHTFVDGVIIAGAFTLNPSTGFLIFLAISFHKIPEGFSMASLYLAAGNSRKRAFLTSLGLAISTLIGAVITLMLRDLSGHVITVLMAVATGTFLYISTTELIPSIKGQQRTTLGILIGVTLFYGSLLLIKHVGLG